MTHHAEVLNAWAQLPPEVREVAAPIETEKHQQALELFEGFCQVKYLVTYVALFW